MTAVMYLRHRGRHEQILIDMLSSRGVESGTASAAGEAGSDQTRTATGLVSALPPGDDAGEKVKRKSNPANAAGLQRAFVPSRTAFPYPDGADNN